jgi:hypothetical protein
MHFQEMNWVEEFDGIWASASLLHVPLAEMPDVFALCIKALKPGGYWCMTFKVGEGETMRGIRRFTDFTKDSLAAFLARFDQLKVLDVSVNGDIRAGREAKEQWVGAVVQKVPAR